MEYYVPCPCNGKESPCFACCETGMIGPLSLYEYNAYYANLRNQNGMVKSHPSNGKGKGK